ncbi:MAG TPA: signal peptide peptidase SppA [Verrucomicrobiae bacterium]|jgi:protease-4|nr:signal peptide peptidase SppA [Verrucomicrobiae bacterium]
MDNSFSSPPPLTPPPVIAPPPPSKPRKSRGWMIVSIILIVLLGFSLFGNFTQFVSHAFSSNRGFNPGFKTASARQIGPKLDEYTLEDNDAKNKIAVITVDGIITGHTADQAGNSMVDVIKAQLDRAKDDNHVKAVILKIDSPGGEVMASDEINKAIVKFQDDSKKPVVCSMGSLAASGGYYISAPCRWIVANELTLTGSIGVIMHGYNYRGLMDKLGVAPMTFKSGLYKDMLSPDRSTNEIPAGEHKMVQALIDETYQKFKGIVADGRAQAHEKNGKEGKPLANDWADYADGRVVSGTQALKLGFVDELGDFDDAVDRTEKIAHISDANLIEYRERYDISDLFSMFGQSSASHDIKLDLGVEIPKLRADCMYFLWQTPED